MERAPNNNPWADRLQEVSIPDVGEGWTAMATLLDKELPAGEKKDRRRWLLLLLLLLLLSASGYFIWRKHNVGMPHNRSATTASGAPVAALPGHASPGHASPGNELPAPASSAHATSNDAAPNDAAPNDAAPNDAASNDASLAHRAPTHWEKAVYSVARPPYPAGAGGRDHPGRHFVPHRRSTNQKTDRIAADLTAAPDASDNGITSARPLQQHSLSHSNPGNLQPLGIAGPHLVVKVIARSKTTDPLKCPPVEHSKGTNFVFAIGLNQGVPVDGQQVWTNPSGGLNTWWKNYIPVPSIRYYVRPKIYLQLEARIHAPQYTPRNLIFAYKYNDTSYSGGTAIEKLFYFQLPVSIHYSPSDNWSVGLGTQYSHYGKGIVAVVDSSLFYGSIGPLSGFPMVSVKNTELRGLVSVDYTYGHWVLGISYDEAFNRTLTVKVPDPTATPQASVLQAPPPVRNSSLQLYLRYILWDGRKRKSSIPPK